MVADVARLGGGFAQSASRPQATAEAVLRVARPGAKDARLIVVGGPPGVGKSAVVARLVQHLPQAMWIDKDLTASDFILQAAHCQGVGPEGAYGTDQYWQTLRPCEYAGPVALACANLLGRRQVFVVGGWGPELGLADLWENLAARIAPAALHVFHLDPPPPPVWRARLAQRGSRSDMPWFEQMAAALGGLPVWSGAARIETDRPLARVVQDLLERL
ncbi:MAG: hypothetical protein GKR89_08155 [Candidatus Latescibacteria bacterium]|nr:hypothetical protein [Candidatus Latescibacterota bacterium]